MEIIYSDNIREYEFLAGMKRRAGEISLSTNEAVLSIISEVKEKGDDAVRSFGKRFDGAVPERFEISKDEMSAAYEGADEALKKALCHARDNIETYHEQQMREGYELKKDKGVVLGQLVRPLARVGIYVPGGTAAYPSTVLMNAIPARIAGVEEIVMVTPPLVE
ncbi:MAG: hisD, partial [Bacillota bacterium]|nr:hisD [Bacillota bacterium]